MIKSMTGYGRAQAQHDGIDAVVEIRSVNHRFFEFSARVPRSCAFLEDKLKTLVSQMISRGKVDVFVTLDTQSAIKTEIEINHSLAAGYIAALRELVEDYSLVDDISASHVARNTDIFTVKKQAPDEELIWGAVSEAAAAALQAFVQMREQEGARLKQDVLFRAQKILDGVAFVEQRSPQTVTAYRDKIETRIRELLTDANIDEQRLLTETAIFADKIAVAEETVRLRSHFDQLRLMLSGDEPVGRKLDFLVQELNREVNTVGSKAQDVEIARVVVDMKAELEKIREQIQNIE